eukprot:g1034.t1
MQDSNYKVSFSSPPRLLVNIVKCLLFLVLRLFVIFMAYCMISFAPSSSFECLHHSPYVCEFHRSIWTLHTRAGETMEPDNAYRDGKSPVHEPRVTSML